MAQRRRSDPAPACVLVLRRYLKECLGKRSAGPRLAEAEFQSLALGVGLPRSGVVAREDAVQAALTDVVRMARTGRVAAVREMLAMEDAELLRKFKTIARRRMVDAHPNRGVLQALRPHVRAAVQEIEALPTKTHFPDTLGDDNNRFDRSLVRLATIAALKELEGRDPKRERGGLVQEALKGNADAEKWAIRMVLGRLRETYIGGSRAPVIDDELEGPRRRKEAFFADRAARDLLRRVDLLLGPRAAAMLVNSLRTRSDGEMARLMGLGAATVSREMKPVRKLVKDAIQKDKGRVIKRRLDFDASEWPGILQAIREAAAAKGPARDRAEKELRQLVRQVLRQFGPDEGASVPRA